MVEQSLLKRIPLTVGNNHLCNGNNNNNILLVPPPPSSVSGDTPLKSARRLLATLEPTVRGLLDLVQPNLPIVREKLDAMEAAVMAFPCHLQPDEAAIWRAKMAYWWVEYADQQCAAEFLDGVEAGGEAAKIVDQLQLQGPASADHCAVYFPESSVSKIEPTPYDLHFGVVTGRSCRRFRLAAPIQEPEKTSTPLNSANGALESLHDLSTATESSSSGEEEEPEAKRPALQPWSSSSSSSALYVSAAEAAAAAEDLQLMNEVLRVVPSSKADDRRLMIDARDSKEAGLMAIQSFAMKK